VHAIRADFVVLSIKMRDTFVIFSSALLAVFAVMRLRPSGSPGETDSRGIISLFLCMWTLNIA